MFDLVKTVIKHVTTEQDGESFDIARIMWAVGGLVFFGLSIWQCYKHGQFDYQGYAIAFGAIMAAGAASVKIKETTEQRKV